MLTGPQFLAGNLASLMQRIEAATRSAGRPAGSVTLVGVSKTQPTEAVAAARLAGPAANFLLAFALMFFYYAFINEVPKYEVHTTTVEWVIQGSAASISAEACRRNSGAEATANPSPAVSPLRCSMVGTTRSTMVRGGTVERTATRWRAGEVASAAPMSSSTTAKDPRS